MDLDNNSTLEPPKLLGGDIGPPKDNIGTHALADDNRNNDHRQLPPKRIGEIALANSFLLKFLDKSRCHHSYLAGLNIDPKNCAQNPGFSAGTPEGISTGGALSTTVLIIPALVN